MDEPKPEVEFSAFSALDLRVGTILRAYPNEKARKPAYVVDIDFGPLGIKQSSAQLTELYTCGQLLGKQVVAILNFPSKRVAGVKSECLILGALDPSGVVLLDTERKIEPGTPIA